MPAICLRTAGPELAVNAGELNGTETGFVVISRTFPSS
jgi:hypothetical protein